MGGLERYQSASLMGVEKKHFDSSKWCLKTLKDLNLYQVIIITIITYFIYILYFCFVNFIYYFIYKKKSEKGKLKLMDAGSLTDSYRKHTHIYDVTAIDVFSLSLFSLSLSLSISLSPSLSISYSYLLFS